MKKIWTVLFAILIFWGVTTSMPVVAHATEKGIITKTSTAIDEKGRFKEEIQISVETREDSHDEIIIMVDGTYLTLEELPGIQDIIVDVGKKIFEERKDILLTIMVCNQEKNVIFEHVANIGELEALLPKILEEVLASQSLINYYENVFSKINEYIKKHDDTLKNAYVVCMFNGETDVSQVSKEDTIDNEFVQNEKISHLYLIDCSGKNSWMEEISALDSKISSHKVVFVSDLLEILNDIFVKMTYTSYNDVVVTEYTSKWVNLDTGTIKIVDNYLEKTIWTSTKGWTITENRPTSQELPVLVKEISKEEYLEHKVEGNESGTIYKITWYVKDGILLRNDNYSLIYEVDVDTKEPEFKYNVKYPVDSGSNVEYIRKNGNVIIKGIETVDVARVIINRIETIDISGTKKWVDENNKYGKRPDSIIVSLLANGKKVETINVTAHDNWSYSFKEKPKFDEVGKKIVYTITENKVANYKAKIDGYNITNTYIKPIFQPTVNNDKNQTIDISGTIAWKDEGNKYGKRPDSITVNLIANGTKIASQKVSEETKWTYIFKKQAQYDDKGKKIDYTVSEDKVEGYEIQINNYNIVNTFIKPETFDIVGNITWNDEKDIREKRPDSIILRLWANDEFVKYIRVTGDEVWKYSFKDMPKYDFDGKEITYTIKVDEIVNYQIEIDGYDIINTYNQNHNVTIDVSGTVTWIDNNNKYKKRPNSIIVNLNANGKKVASIVVTNEEQWKYSFKNLSKYDENGKKIVYTVTENEVAQYTINVNGYDIENTYKKSVINVSLILTIISGCLLICAFYMLKKTEKTRNRRNKRRNKN